MKIGKKLQWAGKIVESYKLKWMRMDLFLIQIEMQVWLTHANKVKVCLESVIENGRVE